MKKILEAGSTNILYQYATETVCYENNRSIGLVRVNDVAILIRHETYIFQSLIRKVLQQICGMLIYIGSIYRIKKVDGVGVVAVREYSRVLYRLR